MDIINRLKARNRVLSGELLSTLEWLREICEESEGGMSDVQRREIEKSEELAKMGLDDHSNARLEEENKELRREVDNLRRWRTAVLDTYTGIYPNKEN